MEDTLKLILEKLEKLDKIETEIAGIKEQLSTLETKVDSMDKKIDRNYDLTLEFYGMQKEANTKVADKLNEVDARVDIFSDQTVKNTAALKKIS